MRVLLINVVLFLAFAALHSLLANVGLKERLFSRFPRAAPWYRLGYNLLAVLTLLAWYLLAPFPDGVLYDIAAPWSLLLHLIQALGIAGFLMALKPIDLQEFMGIRQIHENRTELDLHRGEGDELVTKGLYGIVRHPLYTSSVLVLAFNPLMTAKLAVITVLFALYFAVGSIHEERNLLKLYGDQYLRYQENVPRFIPRIDLF